MKELFRRVLMRLVIVYIIMGVMYALGSLPKGLIVSWKLHVALLGMAVVGAVFRQMVHQGGNTLLKESHERDRWSL